MSADKVDYTVAAPETPMEKTSSSALGDVPESTMEGKTTQQGGRLDAASTDNFYRDAVGEAYRIKSELVAEHLAKIGFGKFQICLFCITGLGWMSDNFWSQGIAAVRPPVANEFTDIGRLSYSSIAYYVGLIVGASFWGTAVDIIGRKPAFKVIMLYGAAFALAVAGVQNFTAFCCVWAVIGTAAGGNVPVDSIVFLEFLPASHQWLLVILSAWWNAGQLVVSLVAWVFLSYFACNSSDAPCAMEDNMGWRYTMITLGGLAFVFGLLRVTVFNIPESPRYLLSRGRDQEVVEALAYIAKFNGKPQSLTLDMLQEVDRQLGNPVAVGTEGLEGLVERPTQTVMARLKESFADYGTNSYKSLFAGRKLAQHTTVLLLIWLTVGIAYPLYFVFITSYLQSRSGYSPDGSLSYTYKIYCIVSAVGVIGPLAAGFLVETRLGRRWMMAISAALTGVFLFAYTSVDSKASDIGFQCATAILGNFEYAIMFAFTPESFPGPVRGTGTGIAATLLRLGGLVASFISTYAGYSVVPIYTSAALWIVVGFLCLGLPYETHGHASI
ncbi:hypothetical protein NLU13_7882 [Sarocladium strictum]|uniref:Major facilitator superfamily (MFS) profile domain-containing protein n=1 Tax=Sarocladium strictum TaxID=5046 RepID=A0AA39GE75_SARSR|nr:hypothetical protein NLU13_7882 [Sarocladium strictum]